MVSLTVLNQAVFADRTELRLIVLVFDDAHSGISLAIPGSFLKKSWSGVKKSVACEAGGIFVPGAQNREGER